MMKFMIPLIALFTATSAFADAKIGSPAPDFSLFSAAGKEVKLSDYNDKVVVLEWTNPGCPFVKKFYDSGEMQKLQGAAVQKGVVWLSINSSAEGKEGNLDAKEASEFVSAKKSQATAYLLDTAGTAGHLYGAKTTPHMFVIDKGTLVYAGAIDDKPTPNPADIRAANNYVTAAIEATLAGQKPKVASTQAYGCNVKY